MHCAFPSCAASRRIAPAATLLLLCNLASCAAEDEAAAGNVYMAGAEVRIDRPVQGDLVAAAGRILVEQPVSGDVVLGAGSLDVQASVGDDLRAAGGIVALASPVKGEVLIAAARISLRPGAEVHGQAWLAGSNVSIDGRLLAGVRVYGREVSVLGEIRGPLEIAADRIHIRGSARIHGDVTYQAAHEIAIDPLAQVTGSVTRTASALQARDSTTSVPGLKPLRPLLLAGLFAAAVLLHALLPRFVENCVRVLGASPIKSVGLGSALFFGVPPVAVLLIITIIGIPIGLALAAFYATALVVGYLVTAFFIAEKFARPLHHPSARSRWRLALVAGALILLALMTSMPYAGPLVLLLALAAGLGAMVMQAFSRPVALGAAAPRSDSPPAA